MKTDKDLITKWWMDHMFVCFHLDCANDANRSCLSSLMEVVREADKKTIKRLKAKIKAMEAEYD